MAKKSKMGRPRLPPGEKLGVMLSFNVSAALVGEIEAHAEDQFMSRAEAARDLIERGLRTRRKGK